VAAGIGASGINRILSVKMKLFGGRFGIDWKVAEEFLSLRRNVILRSKECEPYDITHHFQNKVAARTGHLGNNLQRHHSKYYRLYYRVHPFENGVIVVF
jgi:hypothetical protein